MWSINQNANVALNSREARTLFCGAALATAIQGAYANPADEGLLLPATHASNAVTTAVAESNHTVVFVDRRVEDAEALLNNLAVGTELVYLDETEEGLQQIASVLKNRSNVGSLQIISHGEAGALLLGKKL
jgi:hypothetical protein